MRHYTKIRSIKRARAFTPLLGNIFMAQGPILGHT